MIQFLLIFLDDLIEKTKLKPSKNYPAAAYQAKGRYYIFKNDKKKSLHYYLQSLKYNKVNKNDSLENIIKHRIGFLKMENNEIRKAKKLYLDVFRYYRKIIDEKFSDNYASILTNLSNTYTKLNKIDSAIYFNNKLKKYSLEHSDSLFLSVSYYSQGKINFKQKEYNLTIINLKKTLFQLNDDENYLALIIAYNLIAKSYNKLDSLKKALKYNLKIDSLSNAQKITHKSQKDSYTFLINHYRENGNVEKQLLYINKLIKLDSILDKQNKEFTKTFIEEYDIPNLKAEKQLIIKQLEHEAKISEKAKIVLFFIALIFIIITGYQYHKRSILQNRFVTFQNKLNEEKNSSSHLPSSKEVLTIPKETVSAILNGLSAFEIQKEFTDSKITLHVLAKRLKTNANYLSKTVNHYKNSGFSEYLNSLRVNYAISLLQKDSKIRKYTIKAIANEVGFNTAESFAKAFLKKTKMKPSFYIKELNKRNVT
jgi:AraC-like DNA-binding protein